MARGFTHHAVAALLQGRFSEIWQSGNWWRRKDPRSEIFQRGIQKNFNRLPHLGLPSIFPWSPLARRAIRDSQVRTKIQDCSLPSIFPLPFWIIIQGYKHKNLAHVPLISFVLKLHLLHSGSHEEEHSPSKLQNLVEEHLELSTQENSLLKKSGILMNSPA